MSEAEYVFGFLALKTLVSPLYVMAMSSSDLLPPLSTKERDSHRQNIASPEKMKGCTTCYHN